MISFDEAFDWFYAFERSSSITREEIFLFQVIDQKINQRNYSKACQVIQYLKSYQRNRAAGDEKGEIWLKFAKAYYKMQNAFEAIRSLKMAEKEFTPVSHERWVIRWMLGSLQWFIENDHGEALISWTEALEGFRLLESIAFEERRMTDRNWYVERIMEMMNTLQEKIFETFS
jgi:tetratricopeptide (TPR) repeat protein